MKHNFQRSQGSKRKRYNHKREPLAAPSVNRKINQPASALWYISRLAWIVLVILCFSACISSGRKTSWKDGVVKDEFIYDTAPFPACHAATIAETPQGLVAAFFGGTKERNPDVEIRVCRLVNGHWTPPVSVANGIQNDTLRYPTWNPVLYQVPGGDLLLFYKVGPKPAAWKGWLVRSSDGGITWSAPKALPEGFLGPVKNKPVLLADGKTLLCPSSTENDGWKVHIEKTTDFGKTWEMTGPVDDGQTDGAIQPSILFHPNHVLQLLCRSRNRAILTSWSKDNGQTWSPLKKTELPNNNSGTDAVTLRDGRQVLVYNHVIPPAGKAKGARTPLNLSVSDDGVHWSAAVILEDSPISQYSYPSVIQTRDGMIHVVYTWRRKRIKHVVIDPSKITTLPIKDSTWPALKGYTAPVAEK